jgi:Zn finger protein HypA/HybF involved in hydrogenase expression
MHEMSIALEVCRLAEEAVAPLGPECITSVGLLVGDDAGLEITSLAFCLETLLTQSPFVQASPELQRVPGDVLRLEFVEVDDDRAAD